MTSQTDTVSIHKELLQMRRFLERHISQNDGIKDALKASTDAISELKSGLSLSHEQLREARRTHLQLQEAKAQSETALEALQQKFSAFEEKARVNLLGEQARRKTAEEKANIRIKALEADIAALKANHAGNSRDQDEVAQLREALEERLKDIALLGEEIARLTEQNAQLRAQKAEKQSEVDALGAQLDERNQALAQLSQERQRLTILNQLKHPQERLHKQLARNNIVSSARRQARTRLDDDIRLISKSDLFDAQWYKTTYPDIGDQDPARHFAMNGAYELRNPSAGFDSLKYHVANPDVTKGGLPALMHYLKHGKADGRQIHPVD